MKILHVNFSDHQGGASIAVLRLHKILLDKGIDSYLLVSDKELNEKNIISTNKTFEKIKNIIKSSITRNLEIIFKTSNKNTHSLNIFPSNLLKVINDFDADVVNLHWLGNETLSIKQISKIKSKIVWTLHDMWPFCGAEHYTYDERFEEGYLKNNRPGNEKGIDLNRYIWNKKFNYFSKIDKIITTSTWMKNCSKNSSLFKNKPVEEIPLILDPNKWFPITDSISSKKILGLSLNKKVITYGSDNYFKNERKGFKYFLDLVDRFDNMKNFEFVIFGEDNFEKLNTFLAEKKYKNKIFNLGKIKDEISMKLLYSATDVIISPSLLEAFGLIVQEGSFMGVPSVVFDNTGSESIIDHKKNGYVAKYKSTSDLFKGTEWCLNNLYNKNEIHEYSKEKFNSDKIIKKYLNFIEN